jgi:AcrR family transcriptional regulator
VTEPPTPRLNAPDRRRTLLEVAAATFLERGYARTTTRLLADAAGVTEPILYRHFDDKADCFLSTLQHVVDHLDDEAGIDAFAGLCIAALDGPMDAGFIRRRDALVQAGLTELQQHDPPGAGPDIRKTLEAGIGRLVLERLQHRSG